MAEEKNYGYSLETLRHSAAHLLAHAVQELYPTTQLTIGPATADGFFYDLLPDQNFKEEDLPLIEQKMREIAQRNIPLTHTQVSKQEARTIYQHNPFKLELIDSIPGETVGIATQGNFIDLCRGGHVASTGQIKHFKLLGLSGSYWRANKNNQVLQRISGTAFFTASDLEAFLQRREDAIKYDHRRLGKQLDLFSFHEEGAGFPFYHPKGKTVINTLINHLRSLLETYDYQEVSTPTMLSDDLWKQSGHYAHYKENMFFSSVEDHQYAIKPMNCPGAILIYKERPRSYRELPLRLAEFGNVHRFELSGVLHGLFRARAFTIDDGHIFCTPDQLEAEILTAIQINNKVWEKFTFSDVQIRVATRPEKAMGEESLWKQATDALIQGLEKAGCAYTLAPGEGAFYGPKIEFHIKDCMDRSWQCGTIQVDFAQPENFDLSYINNEGKKARPVMIHRAIYGSLERFFGVLLEHYKGRLPFWLAPVQINVLTITDEQKEFAHSVADRLKKTGLRVAVDESSDQISAQIKNSQLQQIPWSLVIGKKEVANNTVTLRYLDGKQEFGITIEQLLEKAAQGL